MVQGQHGWLQGYNAHAASNEHRIVVAAEIAVVSPDFGNLEPMVIAARRELQAAGVTNAPKVVVADSGDWHTEQMGCLAAAGIAVLIAPDLGLRKNPRPGWNGGRYAFMRNVLNTEHGTDLYKQRQHLIETLFGSIKHNRRITHFQRRGNAAVRTEWRLTATHNRLKLHKRQTRHHDGLTAVSGAGPHPRAFRPIAARFIRHRRRRRTYATAPSKGTTSMGATWTGSAALPRRVR
jgi:hypothetical protein